MISREELNQLKEQRRTTLYYEEKEYLQYIFLRALFSRAEHFTFKGGTCLRLCFGLERASEDLDFNTDLSTGKLKSLIEKLLEDYDYLNISYEIYSVKEFKGNIRWEVRFRGPLYQGKQSSTNTLKIDFNSGKAQRTIIKVIPKIFSDVPPFTLIAMAEEEILAEKVRALIRRSEARDMYDLWMLFSKGVVLELDFLLKKLKEENVHLSKLRFPSKQEYETSLKYLITLLPPYEQVRSEIENALSKITQKK